MRNRKYFPFERNSYYFGKLLTAKDFEAEQRYFNDKRRLVNRVSGANGIVMGLGVVLADDSSVILQAGCAFDASGREIVVPETQVVKLSTVDGFGQLTSSCAYLGILYDEQPVDEVYSAMNDREEAPFYNRVREHYRLTLLDEKLVTRVPMPLDEFVSRLTVYSDGEIEITQYTPRYIPADCDVRLRVELRRTGRGGGEYSFCYTLETPGFDCGGSHELAVALEHQRLSFGETRSLSFTLIPQAHVRGGNSEVAFTVTALRVQKNDESIPINENARVLLQPTPRGLDGLFVSGWYGKAMDKTLGESYDERLWLARLDLIRQDSQVIIERVSPPPFSQYCYNAQQSMLLRRLDSFYPRTGAALAVAGDRQSVQTAVSSQQDGARGAVSGVFDLPLGLGYSTREVLFSEEIMHGLGTGPVHVDAGVEYITAGEDGDRSEVLLGDASLFAGNRGSEERVYDLSLGVKLLPERGTFVVAARVRETSNLLALRVRWYAQRMSEAGGRIAAAQDEGERYILVNPDTILLAPKETAHITPVFINMPGEACNYRLIDAEGGSVDNNGVYTAPAKEGVYEIRIEAISDPKIYTHAFAIVSQKKKDAGE